MNYTENYRLPLWDETDRVLRTDFNQMSQTLEDSLNSVDQSSFLLFSGSARRNYYLAAALKPVPWQIGLFHQRFDQSTLPTNATGFTQWDGFAWAAANTAAPSASDIKNAVTQVSQLRFGLTDDTTSTGVFTFTAPGPAVLHSISMVGKMNSNPSNNGSYVDYTFTNLTTGAVEASGSVTLPSKDAASSSLYLTMSLNTLLHIGYQYRLEASPSSGRLDIRFNFSDSTTSVNATGVYHPNSTVTHSFAEEQTSPGGLVFARYTTLGAGGTLALDWDGVTYAPFRIRSVAESDGKTYQEAEFRRETLVPAKSSLTLRLACKTKGEICLYNWGAALL